MIDDHFECLLFSGKLEFLFEECVVEVEDVYMPGTFLECAVLQLWRVKLSVCLEYRTEKANIACVEDRSYVAFD